MKKRVKCSGCHKMAYESWPTHYKRTASKKKIPFVCRSCRRQRTILKLQYTPKLIGQFHELSRTYLMKTLKVNFEAAEKIQQYLQQRANRLK